MNFFIAIFYQMRLVKNFIKTFNTIIFTISKIPNEISQKENIMNIEKNKNSTYIIRLINNNAMTGTYRVNEKIFNEIEKQIKEYRSLRHKPKKVKCIETGQEFESITQAAKSIMSTASANSLGSAIRRGHKYKGKTYIYIDENGNPVPSSRNREKV